jgi:hypothetical protein
MEGGQGLFCIALKVPNLDEAKGVRCTRRVEMPSLQVAQFNPMDAYGVWIELVEYDTVFPVTLANLGKTGEIPFFED